MTLQTAVGVREACAGSEWPTVSYAVPASVQASATSTCCRSHHQHQQQLLGLGSSCCRRLQPPASIN